MFLANEAFLYRKNGGYFKFLIKFLGR
jgi:hypothetical protein